MSDFLITKDLVQLFENRYRLNLSAEEKGDIRFLEDKFVDEIKGYLPEDLELNVKDRIELIPEANDRPLYLDDVYFKNPRESLSITRSLPLDDLAEGSVLTMPRYGTNSIDSQIDSLKNQKYCLVDVGIFSGATIIENVERLKKRGIECDTIYVGVCNKNSIDSGYLVNPETNEKTGIKVKVPESGKYDFGEWIELRDILGFDGRSIRNNPNRAFYCYSNNLARHATIPDENCDAVKGIAKEYFLRINDILNNRNYVKFDDYTVKQNGKDFLVRSIVELQPYQRVA
jgi:hypothetical protein